MFRVCDVVEMQSKCVERWHELSANSSTQEVFSGYEEGFLAVACRQHRFNYDLWHEEDIARSPDVTDARIAQVKRAIDKLNQQRNDWIEKMDDWLTSYFEAESIQPNSDARLNTETPGSSVDRLSIMSLRIYHLKEQLQRTDVDSAHIEKVQHRLTICTAQQSDLSNSLNELLMDMIAGKKRHRTYRQFKMYNDPTLNPYLYQKQGSKV